MTDWSAFVLAAGAAFVTFSSTQKTLGAVEPKESRQAPARAPAAIPAQDWQAAEASTLARAVQLTTRDQFTKAGEAYFSPDGEWIIFQAIPVPEAGKDADPFYAMYVAKLVRDSGGHVTGIEPPTRISPPGSANTCGWFHPSDVSKVLFGSTMVRPSDEQKSGFQVGSRRYVWMFPQEMEIIERGAFAVGGGINGGETRRGPARKADRVKPLFERANYDAECSYSPDGRFVLYAHVEDRPSGLAPDAPYRPDANLYVFDTKTGKHHPIVVAPGYDGGPFFSPDGKSIAYRSDRKGDDLLQVFVADLKFQPGPDGAAIPVGIEREYQLTSNEHVNWCPYWHPSGEYILYATSEIGHSNYEVFAVESDMKRLRNGEAPGSMRRVRITNAPGADVLPAFSFDGRLVMWTSQRGPKAEGEERPSSQLWIAEWKGSPFAGK